MERKISIGTIIKHSHHGTVSYYIVAAAGESLFILVNLLYGTRASSPYRFSSSLTSDGPNFITMSMIREHMGTLIGKDSTLEILKDVTMSYTIAPVDPLKGTIAIGLGGS